MSRPKIWANAKYLFSILLLAGAYFIFAKIGLSMAIGVKQVTLFWPPTGIAIASLLIFGRKLWPGIFIGAFLANVTTNEPVLVAASIAIGNTLEALVAQYFLLKMDFKVGLQKVQDVIKFIFFASFLAPMVSATIGTTSLLWSGIIGSSVFNFTWLTWWLGDAVGSILFAPLIFSFKHVQIFPFRFKKLIEVISLFVSTGIVSIFVFTGYVSQTFSTYPIKYAVFPFMVWSALSFGLPGATWTTLIISTISILGFRAGGGPFFAIDNPEVGLILLQLLMAVFAVTSLILAAIVEERKRIEKRVSSSEKRFKSLIENSYEALVLVDPLGKIIYASPSIERILGYKPEEVERKDGFALIDPANKAYLIKTLAKLALSPGKTIHEEIKTIAKDGTPHFAEATATNLLQEEAVGAIVVNFRDITEHKKLDETKGEFVSLAAHELRNPLSSIRWYSESLIKAYTKKDKVSEYINEIYESVVKMTSLVNMLLNISKVEMGKLSENPEKIDLAVLSQDVIQNLKPDIRKKDLKLSESYSPKSITAFIDPNLIRIVIENLLSNSIKYTPDLGKIDFKIQKNDGDITIEVKDTGLGIPESQKGKIFTKLFRADNVKRRYPNGTGLGLYLVKQVVGQLKGTIEFESNEKSGTKFTVSFPLKKENA